MFIDYLTLMLTNMAVGLVLFALYMVFFFEKDSKKVVPGFLIVGAIALITGFKMIFTWPLPGSFNIAYGEPTVLLGAFLFMAGLAINFGWDLLTIGIYSAFAGAATILLGIRIFSLSMGSNPLEAALGFIGSGATAILALPAIALPRMKWIRWIAALAAIVTAVAWVYVAGTAYWGHLSSFGKWAPDSMILRIPPAPASK
jgi:putative membrane protein